MKLRRLSTRAASFDAQSVPIGFWAGRELILTKPEITIGRAESCDIGLFGDSGVARGEGR